MSLRARTTLLVAVVTATLLVAGALSLDAVLRHRLTGSADQQRSGDHRDQDGGAGPQAHGFQPPSGSSR